MQAEQAGTDHLAVFEQHRPRLFGIAYRMLGTVQDAEDIVQEAYLRWHQADQAEVRSPEGWLVAVTTRLAIDRLRRAATEREAYVGDWLPEPVAMDVYTPSDRQAELASDLSMAFLVMLQRLAPEERAALLLRDVFDASYEEIARVLDRSEVAVRQVVHRARLRVRGDRARRRVSPEVTERLVERFLEAVRTEDQAALLAIVAEDATYVSDSGGKALAARNVLRGAWRIVRFALGLERKYKGLRRHEVMWLNGQPALATFVGDLLYAVTSVETDGERLVSFYSVLNPDKLRRLQPRGSGR